MLTIGENTYIALADANTYFSSRANASAWDIADDPTKEQVLSTAARMLNDIEWVGIAVSDNQKLAFPRSGEYYEPILGKLVTLDNTIPQRIKDANCEQAFHLLLNTTLLDNSPKLKSIQVDTIRLDGLDIVDAVPPLFSSTVERLYAPLSLIGLNRLLRNGQNNSWWRAN
jgi:hypothetical protein